MKLESSKYLRTFSLSPNTRRSCKKMSGLSPVAMDTTQIRRRGPGWKKLTMCTDPWKIPFGLWKDRALYFRKCVETQNTFFRIFSNWPKMLNDLRPHTKTLKLLQNKYFSNSLPLLRVSPTPISTECTHLSRPHDFCVCWQAEKFWKYIFRKWIWEKKKNAERNSDLTIFWQNIWEPLLLNKRKNSLTQWSPPLSPKNTPKIDGWPQRTLFAWAWLLLFSSTPWNETGDMPRENCQTVPVTL